MTGMFEFNKAGNGWWISVFFVKVQQQGHLLLESRQKQLSAFDMGHIYLCITPNWNLLSVQRTTDALLRV